MAVLMGSGVNSNTADAIQVEMAEIKVSSRLTDRLVAYGLGACIGVCLYDPSRRIAGMAHIVLPECPTSAMTTSAVSSARAGKFADTAIPALVDEVCKSGAFKANLRAAIAGGAHIFSALSRATPGTTTSRLEIGARNVASVTEALEAIGIPVVASDVGGNHGRTLGIRACDGHVTIRPIGGAEILLISLGKSLEGAA